MRITHKITTVIITAAMVASTTLPLASAANAAGRNGSHHVGVADNNRGLSKWERRQRKLERQERRLERQLRRERRQARADRRRNKFRNRHVERHAPQHHHYAKRKKKKKIGKYIAIGVGLVALGLIAASAAEKNRRR